MHKASLQDEVMAETNQGSTAWLLLMAARLNIAQLCHYGHHMMTEFFVICWDLCAVQLALLILQLNSN